MTTQSHNNWITTLMVTIAIFTSLLGARLAPAQDAKMLVPEPKYLAQTDEQTIIRKVNYRANDKLQVQLQKTMTINSVFALYQEASQMIDARHFDPPTYTTRNTQAMKTLKTAVQNGAFDNGKASTEKRNQIAAQLENLETRQAVRTAQEAAVMMQMSTQLVSTGLGVDPVAVAMEYVHGTMDSLDRYSAINPEETRLGPSANLKGIKQIVGVGVEMKPHAEGALIVRPVQNGPADKAGIQSGDIIVRINGITLAGKPLNEVADMVSGPEGSEVLFTISRNGHNSMVPVTRSKLTLKSVSEVRMLGDANKTGYIRVDEFAEATLNQLDEGLWKLHKSGMKNLIIDLRGNPGGLLTTAIGMADRFLPSGMIVQTRGRNASDNTQESAKFARTWKVPLVVLIDENSASASEIFAAAIQENGRGLVVGTRSYGKGTVQTHLPLRSAPATLKLTTARFFSPNGRVMSGAGVSPDINVELAEGSNGIDTVLEEAIALINQSKPQQLLSQMSLNGNGNS